MTLYNIIIKIIIEILEYIIFPLFVIIISTLIETIKK